MRLAELHEPQLTLHCWRCRAKLPFWLRAEAYADGSPYRRLWRSPGVVLATTREGQLWKRSTRNQQNYERTHRTITSQSLPPDDVAQLKRRVTPSSRRQYINPAIKNTVDELAAFGVSWDTPIERPEAWVPVDVREFPLDVECPTPGCKVPNRLDAEALGVSYDEDREMEIFQRLGLDQPT